MAGAADWTVEKAQSDPTGFAQAITDASGGGSTTDLEYLAGVGKNADPTNNAWGQAYDTYHAYNNPAPSGGGGGGGGGEDTPASTPAPREYPIDNPPAGGVADRPGNAAGWTVDKAKADPTGFAEAINHPGNSASDMEYLSGIGKNADPTNAAWGKSYDAYYAADHPTGSPAPTPAPTGRPVASTAPFTMPPNAASWTVELAKANPQAFQQAITKAGNSPTDMEYLAGVGAAADPGNPAWAKAQQTWATVNRTHVTPPPTPSPAPLVTPRPTLKPTDPQTVIDQVPYTHQDPNVENRLAGILQPGSPLMTQARTKGYEAANARGLLNSSMGAEAGENAVMNAALPIAAQDASQASAAELSRQGFEQSTGLTGQQIAGNIAVTGMNNTSQQLISANQLQAQRDIAALDETTKMNIAGLDIASQQQIAGMNVTSADRAHAMAAAAAVQSSYQSMFQSIISNPNIPADVRQAYLTQAAKVGDSNMHLIEQLYGVELTWDFGSGASPGSAGPPGPAAGPGTPAGTGTTPTNGGTPATTGGGTTGNGGLLNQPGDTTKGAPATTPQEQIAKRQAQLVVDAFTTPVLSTMRGSSGQATYIPSLTQAQIADFNSFVDSHQTGPSLLYGGSSSVTRLSPNGTIMGPGGQLYMQQSDGRIVQAPSTAPDPDANPDSTAAATWANGDVLWDPVNGEMPMLGTAGGWSPEHDAGRQSARAGEDGAVYHPADYSLPLNDPRNPNSTAIMRALAQSAAITGALPELPGGGPGGSGSNVDLSGLVNAPPGDKGAIHPTVYSSESTLSDKGMRVLMALAPSAANLIVPGAAIPVSTLISAIRTYNTIEDANAALQAAGEEPLSGGEKAGGVARGMLNPFGLLDSVYNYFDVGDPASLGKMAQLITNQQYADEGWNADQVAAAALAAQATGARQGGYNAGDEDVPASEDGGET